MTQHYIAQWSKQELLVICRTPVASVLGGSCYSSVCYGWAVHAAIAKACLREVRCRESIAEKL